MFYTLIIVKKNFLSTELCSAFKIVLPKDTIPSQANSYGYLRVSLKGRSINYWKHLQKLLAQIVFILIFGLACTTHAQSLEQNIQPTPETKAAIANQKEAADAYLSDEEKPAVLTAQQPNDKPPHPCPIPPTAPIQRSQTVAKPITGPIQFAGGMACIVNDRMITVDQIKQEMGPFITQLRRESRSDIEFKEKTDALALQILTQIENRILVVQEAEKIGLKIPEGFLKNFFDGYIADHFGGNLSQYHEYLKAIGQSDAQFKTDLKEQLIFDYMRSQKKGFTCRGKP